MCIYIYRKMLYVLSGLCVGMHSLCCRVVYLRELRTLKLLKRATGWLRSGKWLRESVDLCNCYNCLAPYCCPQGNKGSSTSTARLQLTKDYVSVIHAAPFTYFKWKIDILRHSTHTDTQMWGRILNSLYRIEEFLIQWCWLHVGLCTEVDF